MDWSKFKNIAIAIFVVLNIILCVLISENKNKKYVMQDVQIRRMQAVFAKENAAVYTTVDKEFYPMSMLKLSVNNINDSEVCKTFFGDINNMKKYVDNEKFVYDKDGNGQVAIYKNGLIKYTKENIIQSNKGIDKEQARNDADKYIDKLGFLKSKYIYTQLNITNEEYIFEYNSFYEKSLILSNYVRIHFKQGEISQVDISNFNIKGYTNEQREISSSDEVLINLLYEVKEKYNKEAQELHVMDIDLGYFVESVDINDYLNIKAEPYYRIQVNESDVYLINAYTNEMLDNR
ncbi:MAG TPA: hypothetical protein DCP90_09145 [Clostridiales bacterium]|nr:MAG: hypothetical protein A2Y22_02905 [Clostridiales bacterium GWD2_32_59]HAN10758.1 hypothetical protein [Clostridiales bacterium]